MCQSLERQLKGPHLGKLFKYHFQFLQMHYKAKEIQNKRYRKIKKRHNFDIEKAFYRFILGSVLGFLIGTQNLFSVTPQLLCIHKFHSVSWFVARYGGSKQDSWNDQTNIYIGMMSMNTKINTRVQAALNTWASRPGVKIEIFADNNGSVNTEHKFVETYLQKGIRIIQLAGVSDNVYPPQKKSFSMIKFMHDMYIDKYDWFVRLDDDAYVNIEQLRKFLNKINSSEPLYIGHPGFGKDADDYVQPGDNYCMGGTGMIFSKALLRTLAPKLGECLQNLLTAHEDIELGRCVTKASGVKCSMAWESLALFYQNYQNNTYAANIKHPKLENFESGIILHANKDPLYQRSFHVKLLQHKVKSILSKITSLEKEIRREYDYDTEWHNLSANVQPGFQWNTIVWAQSYQVKESQLNKKTHVRLKDRLLENVNTYFSDHPEHQKVKNEKLKVVLSDSTYYISNPLFSFDSITRLFLTYESHYGKNRTLMEKKRKLFIHQRQHFFKSVQFFYEPYEINPNNLISILELERKRNKRSNEKTNTFSNSITSTVPNIPVHFLMALSGRPDNFVRFLNNFETTFLQHENNITLIVVFFPKIDGLSAKNSKSGGNNNSTKQNNDVLFFQKNINSLKKRYPLSRIELILMKPGTEFSRGVGLQKASEYVKNGDDILFFCDVDLVFTGDIVRHIRQNTVQGKRVYYPVFFSQYDPNQVYKNQPRPPTHFSFKEFDGFWRYFSFGMLAIYKSDFSRISGFDMDIHGWGLEDLRLVESIQKIKLDLFQSAEPAQVHVYHDKICSNSSSPKQFTDCSKSRLSHIGPKIFLYYLWKAAGH